MKSALQFATVLCITLFTITACKKSHSSSSSSQQDVIVGKWKPTQTAIDTNNNGKIDPGELMPADSVTARSLLIFNSGGSGSITLNSAPFGTLSWTISSASNLQIIETSIFFGTDTTVQHIDTLTSSRMVLRDNSGISAVWQIFVKQ